MAATTDEMKAPEKAGIRAEVWAMAGVAGVALLCMGLLAGALALILGKGSRIQVNSVIGNGAVYAPPTKSSAQPASAVVPAEGDQPLTGPPVATEEGAWVARAEPPASSLPGTVAVATTSSHRAVPEQGSWIARAQASAQQAPPSYAGAAYVPPVLAGSPARTSVPFEIRGDMADLAGGNQILPMPVRHAHVYARHSIPLEKAAQTDAAYASPAPAQATVNVRAVPVPVQAHRDVAVPAQVVTKAPAPEVSTLAPVAAAASGPRTPVAAVPASKRPAGSYVGAPARGSVAELRLLEARSTEALTGYKSSPGNLFFTAQVRMRNLGKAPLTVGGEAFDLDDSDGESYMAMPIPASAPLVSGAWDRRTLVFLVPKDAVLSTLSLVLPSETDPITLSRP